MAVRPVYAASLLAVSLGAFAYLEPVTMVPGDEEMGLSQDEQVVTPAQPVDEAASPPIESTTVATPEPAPIAGDAAVKPPYAEPPITVSISPEDRDTLINKDVVDAISADSRLSGKIGVETYRQVVTLTGRVSNPMQAERAEQIARGVTDVNDVQNLIRARVGG
jgi:hypothetical protein